MATLEDRILGEKKQYYCDSDTESEDSTEVEPADVVEDIMVTNGNGDASATIEQWEGTAVNTGPKGVIRDWQRYKQLETERRQCQLGEKQALIQKLALTCRSNLDDERDKCLQDDLDEEIASLNLDDDFLKEYMQKRMQDMWDNAKKLPTFGSVTELTTGEQFLQAVDDENKDVTVVVHLYDDHIQACETMNGCLECLAQEYPNVKFGRMRVSVAHLTKRFTVKGLPALVVYKGGNLIGNFLQLTKELGDDFFAVDIEGFLIENGIFQDRTMVPDVTRETRGRQLSDHSSGSDFELD